MSPSGEIQKGFFIGVRLMEILIMSIFTGIFALIVSIPMIEEWFNRK
jgi:hypothetical protein